MQDSGQEKLYSMLQLLAQSEGTVTVSYCHFDINDNKVVSPAHVFLQCYRMKMGEKNADFQDVKQLPSALVPKYIFDERDYWSTKLVEKNPLKVHKDLLTHFSNLAYGVDAEISRNADQFTAYDGLVSIDQNIFDPRKNKQRTMTAGKLEMIAKCPYSYFLSEILGVRPVEEMEFNPLSMVRSRHSWKLTARNF